MRLPLSLAIFTVEADRRRSQRICAKGSIYYQDKPLGKHAIRAADSMDDEIVVAFADTLFRADFTLIRKQI